jgi:hypothetical protein
MLLESIICDINRLKTYLLHGRVLFEKLTGFAANQEIPRILWNPKVHYCTHKRPPPVPPWANSIQSPQPLPTSSRSILILSSHLRLGLPNGLFPSGFPTKTLKRWKYFSIHPKLLHLKKSSIPFWKILLLLHLHVL